MTIFFSIILIALILVSAACIIFFCGLYEYQLSVISLLIYLILLIGLFITSETPVVYQNEFQLTEQSDSISNEIEQSDVTAGEYNDTLYLIGCTDPATGERFYKFSYKDAEGVTNDAYISNSQITFDFAEDEHYVIIQEIDTITKYYHVVPIESKKKYNFIIVIPRNSILETYKTLE